MSSKVLHPLRQKCLHGVHGKVLEIGFGTGLNLPFYSKDVVEVHAVDVNPKIAPKALQRIEEVPFPVQHHLLLGESLPMEDESFDFVVSHSRLAVLQRCIRQCKRSGGCCDQVDDSVFWSTDYRWIQK